MTKRFGIEEKIDKLMELAQRAHDQLDIHEWTRVHRPWDDPEVTHPKKTCKQAKCYRTPDQHAAYWVKCWCGTERIAKSKEEFDAAEQEYDGY